MPTLVLQNDKMIINIRNQVESSYYINYDDFCALFVL